MLDARQRVREAHRARLRDPGEHPVRVLLGGATLDDGAGTMNGTLLVARRPSDIDAVRALRRRRPVRARRRVRAVEIRPWAWGLGHTEGVPMIDKIFPSAAAALADVADGATVMIGGFGTAGLPNELTDALIAQGARDLTIVNNNAGNGDTGLAALLAAGRVRKIICSFPRQADSHHFDRLYRAGKIELELVPQGNLAERIRAAGAGIGGFFTPTGYGTELAKGKETREIDGPHVRAGVADPRRLRADQGRARRPLGQPDLPHDGAQLRPGDGDGGAHHGGHACTRWWNSARSTRSAWSRRGCSCSAWCASSASPPAAAASRPRPEGGTA